MKEIILKQLVLNRTLDSCNDFVLWADISDLEVLADKIEKQLLIHSVSQQRELLLQAYKDGFDSATESIVAANKMVQERKLQ